MTVPGINYFLGTIRHLRSHEEMVIYDRYSPVSNASDAIVITFLEQEYAKERVEYPGAVPAFESNSAIWAARTVYIASQLLLYRDKTVSGMRESLPAFSGAQTPGAILSADLCLRFLPALLEKAKEIAPEDELIAVLEEHLTAWHFSGVGYRLDAAALGWEIVLGDACVKQLYTDRVIMRKVRALAMLPVLYPGVMATLGNWGDHFWKELSLNI